MTELDSTPIDWRRALQDAEWLAGSTADTAERNLARAYLTLLTDAGDWYVRLYNERSSLTPLAERRR